MAVEMKTRYASPEGTADPGDVIELTNEEERQLVEQGYATRVEQAAETAIESGSEDASVEPSETASEETEEAEVESEPSPVDATPKARELAEENGLDLHEVEGTGKDGRVTKSDVEDAL